MVQKNKNDKLIVFDKVEKSLEIAISSQHS